MGNTTEYDYQSEDRDVDFECIVKETGSAWLLKFDNDRAVWFPKSRCSITHDDGGRGALTAPIWLLEKACIHYED